MNEGWGGGGLKGRVAEGNSPSWKIGGPRGEGNFTKVWT